MNKLLLVDAYSMIFRSYYAFINAPRITSKGENVSAVFGFVNTMNELLKLTDPSHVVVAFDAGKQTFRKQLFPQYKATRESTPEDIKKSLPYILAFLEAMNICHVALEGYEADDIIGTLAKKAEKDDYEVIMATSDKDYVQLMSDKISMLKPSKHSGFALTKVTDACNHYGITTPKQMIDLLGLQGDTSDNVPGCKGIGPKTATGLILQYGDIDGILQNVQHLTPSIRDKITANESTIRLSQKLVTIETNVPLTLTWEEAKLKPINRTKIINLYTELEFKSLITKIEKTHAEENCNLFSQTQEKDIPVSDPPPLSEEELLIKYLLNPEMLQGPLLPSERDQLRNNEKLWKLYTEIELPLLPILKQMSKTGVRIDAPLLKQEQQILEKELSEISSKIYEQVGETFNINSPKQVGHILFEVLQIDKGHKKSHATLSTSEEVLNAYKNSHPIVKDILEYREIKKLVSTYISALPTYINPATGKIHTTFNQTLTATGRLSSSNPNLQNLPIRSSRGRVIRKAVIPDENCMIVSADYSQIELRLMAHFSQDTHLLKAFKENKDVHSITATRIFRVPLEKITDEQRRVAKTANFGIIYGISSFGLAQQLECSRTMAQQLIDDYFEAFPSIKDFIAKQISFARQHGYVETLFGRRRYLPDITSNNSNVRKYAERNAVNAPIQGSAADIIKKAMVDLDHQLKQNNLKSAMILQIHDELCLNVPNEEVEVVKQLLMDVMQNTVHLSIPLLVECGIGHNWLEAH